jgi:hypothetical protein
MSITRRRSLVAIWTAAALLLVVPAASAQEPGTSKPRTLVTSSPTFTVDPVAYLSTPFVEVTGTLSCDPSASATVIVDIRQRAKGEDIGTVGIEDVSCSAGTWSMSLRSDVGELGGPQFKPGKTEVVAGAFICDSESCTVEEVRATIKVLPG